MGEYTRNGLSERNGKVSDWEWEREWEVIIKTVYKRRVKEWVMLVNGEKC